MNDATLKTQLAEHKWKLYNSQDAGLLPDGQVARYIEGIPHKDVGSRIAFLERFVSVSNYDADATIRYAFCTDPKIDNQTKAGKYRLVAVRAERVDAQGRVGADGSTFRIIQILGEGFLTALNAADARPAGAFLKSGDAGSVNIDGENIYTLRWTAVDPDQMYTLAKAYTISSPSGRAAPSHRKIAMNDDGTGNTVGIPDAEEDGVVVLTTQARLEDDGSGTVEVTVGRPEYQLEVFKNKGGSSQGTRTYYWDVPEGIAATLIASSEAAKKDCQASYSSREGLVNLVVDEHDLTGVTLDTGWYAAGDNEKGQIQKRNAIGQTLAQAKVIADSTPAAGSWLTSGTISPTDVHGEYSVSVIAYPDPLTVSLSRNDYDAYNEPITIYKPQFRDNAGTSEWRNLTMTFRFVGNEDPGDVATALAGYHDITISPNATGTYFHGKGYLITAIGAWNTGAYSTP